LGTQRHCRLREIRTNREKTQRPRRPFRPVAVARSLNVPHRRVARIIPAVTLDSDNGIERARVC
jgi:hypothetical protein